MKKYLKILILPVAIITMLGGFAESVFAFSAVTPLIVHFQNEPLPLFTEANFLPGNNVTRTVGVSNNSGTPQNIIVEAINAVDVGGLGDKLHLVIKEGNTELYNNTLRTFLRTGEVSLTPALLSGASITYSFSIAFDSGANNDTQNATLGFDLCVGFSGSNENRHCGNTALGDDGTTDNGPGNTGGSTGGGGGSTVIGTGGDGGGNGPIVPGFTNLIISNELISSAQPPKLGTIIVTWNTNKLSTSQVIYGLSIGGPYNLNLALSNFGYPNATPEDSNKMANHLVTISGLTPGTYSLRVVSRASPPTVGFEYTFTLGTDGVVRTNSPIATVGPTVGETAIDGAGVGAGTGASGGANEFSAPNGAPTSSSTTLADNNNQNQLATALFGTGWLSWGNVWWLFIALLLLLLLTLFWKRNKKEEEK